MTKKPLTWCGVEVTEEEYECLAQEHLRRFADAEFEALTEAADVVLVVNEPARGERAGARGEDRAMTWTRTERAALDYVIAQLEAGEWFETTAMHDLPPVAWDAMVQCSAALTGYMLPSESVPIFMRLALYLRLLRRVEAWEREDGEWPGWSCPEGHVADGANVPPQEAWFPVEHWRWFSESDVRLAPWRPLWLDAPPYDPAVTPRMRREAIEARRERMRAGINKAAKATFGLMTKAFPEWKP